MDGLSAFTIVNHHIKTTRYRHNHLCRFVMRMISSYLIFRHTIYPENTFYLKWDMLPHEKSYSAWEVFIRPNTMSLEEGIFDERTFYAAFQEFDNQSIESSLESANQLVRIFAILDRRVGKRRLEAMWESLIREENILRDFYFLRLDAEGMHPGKVFTEK